MPLAVGQHMNNSRPGFNAAFDALTVKHTRCGLASEAPNCDLLDMMEPGWHQDGTRMEPGWHQDGTMVAYTLAGCCRGADCVVAWPFFRSHILLSLPEQMLRADVKPIGHGSTFLIFSRKTTYFKVMGKRAQTSIAPYRHDPRTRLIELLKRWLRSNAANAHLSEEEVRRMCALCRDLLNYPNFFMHALSEAYEHLELQLRQVLERDRTCAELAARCLSLSRNLVSDAISFLLLAATHLTQTDQLPSLEDAWSTLVGSLITSLLGLRWTFHLFAGAGTDQELQKLKALGEHAAQDTLSQLQRVREEFAAGHFKLSGLAGPFRELKQQESREHFLVAVEALYDLLYLLGEVLLHFHRISDSLGDYGMIRVSLWLHPCLDSVIEKVQRLQTSLKGLNKAVDSELVIAKARGRTVKKPLPSDRMSSRAHAAVERALVGQDCHLSALLHTLEELKTKSSPERLPHVVEGLGDACVQLQNVLTSTQFRARVGDAFPQTLPSLAVSSGHQRANLQLMNVEMNAEELDACSDPELPSDPPTANGGHHDHEDHDHGDHENVSDHSACFFLFGHSGRSKGISSAMWSTFRSLRGMAGATRALPSPYSAPSPQREAVTLPVPGAPSDLVSELSPSGWMSHTGSNGRTSWHHKSLGPAPWEPVEPGREVDDELFSATPQTPRESREAAETPTQETPTAPVRPETNPFSDAWTPEVLDFGPSSPVAAFQGESTRGRTGRSSGRASTMPVLEKGCLRAEVQRLTTSVQGWKPHDSRSLLITGSQLLIYHKGSMDQVKTVVDISSDVEMCSLLPDGVLSLEVRRKRRSSSLSRFTHSPRAMDVEKKLYFFKFETQELAQQFSEIISFQSRGST
eukprot:Skav209796  [mRNA]  locus=scaffold1201:194772:199557:- [translate_table: standard]